MSLSIVQFLVADTCFPKFYFFAWKLEFSLLTDPASCLPWNNRLILFVFKKMSVRYPSPKCTLITACAHGSFTSAWRSTKAAVGSAHSSRTRCFTWHNDCVQQKRSEDLHCVTRMLKGCIPRDLLLIKCIFMTSSVTFWGETGILFTANVWWWRLCAEMPPIF